MEYANTNWEEDNEGFIITSAEQLAGLAEVVNQDDNSFSGQTFRLDKDIDLSAFEWVPIGTAGESDIGETGEGKVFSGTFDGNGHTISGLYIHGGDEENYLGLFGCVSDAIIKNLHVEGTITGGEYASYIGGVVGQNYSPLGTVTVERCSNTGTITGYRAVGGVVGSNGTQATDTAIVKNCYNTGNVTGYSVVGGIVGASGTDEGKVEVLHCYNTGNVTGDSAVGGVVGMSFGDNVYFQHCVSLANTITGTSDVGRVVGSGSSEYCYAWNGTNGIFTDTIEQDGTDLYYSSSKGIYTKPDADTTFNWAVICPSEDGWSSPTGDDAKYQLPYFAESTVGIQQNPLANLDFVTITFDYADGTKTDPTVIFEIDSALTEEDIPTDTTWCTIDENTGAMTALNLTTTYSEDTTIPEKLPEASVTTGSTTTDYDTLEHAVAAATAAGDQITLLKDAVLETSITISEHITLDVSGYDITGTVNIQGDLKVSGDPVITEVSLASGKTITVSGTLTEGASIGISTADTPTEGNPVTVVTGTNLDTSYFHKAYSTDIGELTLNSEKTQIQLGVHTHTWSYSQGKKADPDDSSQTIDDPSKIVATCNTGTCSGQPTTAELSISASDAVYTGIAYIGASITDEDDIQGAAVIQYQGVGTTSYNSTTPPTKVGTYQALLLWEV